MFLVNLLKKIVLLAQRSGLFSGMKPVIKSLLFEGSLPLSMISKNKSFGAFRDKNGNVFYLIEGVRDAITPEWRKELKISGMKRYIQGRADIKVAVKNASLSVRKTVDFLKCFGFEIKDKVVLEIGCYNGARTYALAAEGATKVTGSDISRYHIIEGSSISEEVVSEQHSILTELRSEVAGCIFGEKIMSGPGTNNMVEFVEDDITCSSLPSNHFDLVCSWEVLEHIRKPSEAFKQIYRILKPGCLAFHEYNPFFALNGGHGPCTLDFFWGHAVLGEEDFERYVREFRPDEFGRALNYYRRSLNRMTLTDLKRYGEESGLETLAIIPWSERSHLELLTPKILKHAQQITPSVTAEDLISPFVWVVYKKPVI
jgi:2-polyprenyl-3-methyl-5-hydroxy-6-metoxy-1,4-benzoquinol methylase